MMVHRLRRCSPARRARGRAGGPRRDGPVRRPHRAGRRHAQRRPAPGHRDHRPERSRQDHPAERAVRLRPARLRGREPRWDSTDRAGPAPAGLAGDRRSAEGLGPVRRPTALENVMADPTCHARAGFWPALLGRARSDRDERALRQRSLAALDRVGIAAQAGQLPDQLAYGLRKRVALARALVAGPRVLLLDEPASGLSEAELPELGDLITQLAADATVVVVEHRMDLMMSVCQAIAVLDFGKLIAHGTPAEVQADPAVTAAYLGAEDPGGDDP